MSNVSHTATGSLRPDRSATIAISRGFGVVALLIEALTTVSMSALGGALYHLAAYDNAGLISNYLTIGAFVAVVFVGLRTYDHRYQIECINLEKDRFRSIAVGWNIAFLCLFAIGFLIKETSVYSRGAIVVFYVAGLAGVMGARALLWTGLQVGFARGWFIARRVFLYGTRARIEQFLERYKPSRNGLQISGVWYLPGHLEDGAGLDSREVRENLREAIRFARSLRVDDVFVVAPWSARNVVVESTEAFLAIPASIHLTPERHLDDFSDLQISRIGPAACLRLARPPLTQGEILAKRTMDIAVASVGILLLWPVLAVIGLLVFAESGRPVFFRQRRHGFNESEFRILKFRTMTCLEDGPNVRQARAGDVRVTRVGRFLRRWNLDELPQLVNVLNGDMSIVGPRPHALSHNFEFARWISNYARRHNVKPGITGWAQVNGLRGPTETNGKMAARIRHDFYYIDNWSITFDLYIIFLTLFSKRVHWNAE
jgi:Undecaprenyl-phosphate glucose phosphotransferase